jgi:hypothetical protein
MPEKVRWKKGGFLDNFDAAAKHVGYDHLPVAYALARVKWPSTDVRDETLRSLIRITDGGDNGASSFG